jgi:hypothetical protein
VRLLLVGIAASTSGGESALAAKETHTNAVLTHVHDVGGIAAGASREAPFSCNGPKPAAIPDGWIQWAGLGCHCDLSIPGSQAALPAPIRWEPCAVATLPGLGCLQMKIDWPHSSEPLGRVRFDAGSTGKPMFLFARASLLEPHPYMEYVVAEVDGPVRFALRRPGKWNSGCTLYAEDIWEGRFAISVQGDGVVQNTISSTSDALIRGEVGKLVPFAGPEKNDDADVWSWSVGKDWFVKTIAPTLAAELHAPSFIAKTVLWSAGTDPDGLPLAGGSPRPIGSDVLFEVGTLTMSGIMAYDEVRGVHPLVRWYGNTAQGAGNMATDGKHIVWTQGEGKRRDDPYHPVQSIMAAPYTTDPVALKPRRLRSEPAPNNIGGNVFAVGCGYAGHDAMPAVDDIIVRISDGMSWELPHKDGAWYWGKVLGFTCEEVFEIVYTPAPNIARVRLKSLGPGKPPD